LSLLEEQCGVVRAPGKRGNQEDAKEATELHKKLDGF
jgi:hypothetical protein